MIMIPNQAFFLTYELLNANGLLPPRPVTQMEAASSLVPAMTLEAVLRLVPQTMGWESWDPSEHFLPSSVRSFSFTFHSMRSTRLESRESRARSRHTRHSTSTQRASDLCCCSAALCGACALFCLPLYCSQCAHDERRNERTKSKELRDVAPIFQRKCTWLSKLDEEHDSAVLVKWGIKKSKNSCTISVMCRPASISWFF